MTGNHSTPRFSVVIAVKDYGRFLADAIESVLAQTLDAAQWELIVVDDGSTDDTREVAARFGDRLRYLHQENAGQGAALNTGFRAARGEWIVLLDADDGFYPTKLAELKARIELDPALSMVHHRLDVVNERGEFVHHTPFRRKLDEGMLRDQLIRYGGTWHSFITTATSALAFRRSALEQILPIPTDDFRTMADGYLVTQMALVGSIGAIHRSLGSYRMHGKNNWTPSALSGEWLETRLLAPLARVSELVRARVTDQALGTIPPAVRVTDDRQFMEYRCLAERMNGASRSALRSYRLLVRALWRDGRISVSEKIWRMLSVGSMLVLPARSYTRLRQWYAGNELVFALRKRIFAPKEGVLAHGSV